MPQDPPPSNPKKCKSKCGCAPKKMASKQPQNGKGDAPRNISANFRQNYGQINWEKPNKNS
jgi:hypothetical protein